MSNPRTLTALAFALAFGAIPARAQDAAEPEAPAAEPEEPPAAEPPAAEPPAARGPLPIMVVVLPTGRVPEELVQAAQQALVDRVTPLTGGRPVHALGAPAIRDAIAACGDDACIGAELARAGAQAGIIARLRARGRRREITIEMRDPVSGAARMEAVSGEIPSDPAAVPEALTALVEPLRPALPSPPPPPATLLVTVNVDGARVQIDGEEIGTSPVASVDIGEGQHEVVVLMPGYLSVRRQARVGPGEQARVDVTLQAIGAVSSSEPLPAGGGQAPPQASGDVTQEWWFWTAIGGGAAVLITIAIIAGVVASSGSSQMLDPSGIMLPPIVGGM